MSLRDYLSIRLLIVLTIITLISASFSVPDDGFNRSRKLHQPITTESTRKISFQDDTEDRDASYDVNEDEVVEKDNDNDNRRTDVDEYKEELRGIAESHEAMSRDDKNNSTDSINNPEISVFPGETSVGAKNFDSHEKSVEEGSDESMTSNEAISTDPELDTDVEELLKFKREEKQKCKRVPSVKKELNSQKEIQERDFHLNDTAGGIPEFGNENVNGGARGVFHNDVWDNDGIRDESQVKRRSPQQESGVKHEYTDLDAASPQMVEKLYRRHQPEMKGLETHLPPATQRDVSEQRKLWERETDEYTLADNLMDLLVKLAANPSHWEQTYRWLKDVQNNFKPSRELVSKKRDSNNVNRGMDDSPNHVLLRREPERTANKSKKKKKKKKKPRYQLLTASTTSASPLTPPTPTTVSAESSTQPHWRVVVDRLFRPSWSLPSNDHASSDIAKVHYTVSEYINDDISAVTDSHRQSPLLRKFHFGKINTHEKGSSQNQHDPIHISKFNSDTSDRSNSRLLTYDPRHQTYQGSSNNDNRNNRYGQYVSERFRPHDNEYMEDYRVPLDHLASDFPRHRGYYNKPWKFSKYDLTRTSNPYLNTERTKWVSKYGPWINSRPPMLDIETENGDRNGMYGKFGSWSPESNMGVPPWHSIDEIPHRNGYRHDSVTGNENKNRSRLNDIWNPTQDGNDDTAVPKITMKTWNSLTSDPATWPFQLSDVKPWPKDKNGKSFNPNADLVRKLGLDVPTHHKKEEPFAQTSIKETMAKINNSPHENGSLDSNKDRKIWPSEISSKIQSVGAWVVPADHTTWKPYELGHRKSVKNSETSGWPDKTIRTWNAKLPDWDQKFGKQWSHTPTWPSKWKQFSYHKVNAAPITKSSSQLRSTQRTRNAFIAVSAVSPSKYPGNEWRKNDIEETSVDHSLSDVDGDDLTTQLLHSPPMMQMNKQKENHVKMSSDNRKNESDQLGRQLEELQQINLEKRNPSTAPAHRSSLAVNVRTTNRANIMDGKENTIMSTEEEKITRN